MPKKAIDLQAITQAEARLKKLLEEHPELRDPERQDALAEWLATLDQEESSVAKKGRPFTYQSDDDKPVTISMRVSKELHTRLERYAKQHRQSISELMRDGIEWRIGEGDPRSLSVWGSTSSPQEYYGNTEGDMLAEIRADNERVLQEVLHGFAQQESQIESLLRVLEQRLPLGNNGANYSNTTIDNTVIQSEHREQVPTTGRSQHGVPRS